MCAGVRVRFTGRAFLHSEGQAVIADALESIEAVAARFRQWVSHRDGEDVADPYDGLTAWHLMEDMERLARMQVAGEDGR